MLRVSLHSCVLIIIWFLCESSTYTSNRGREKLEVEQLNKESIGSSIYKNLGDHKKGKWLQQRCNLVPMKFTVDLNDDLGPFDIVGLTGDIPDLGYWQLDYSIPMHLDYKRYSKQKNLHDVLDTNNFKKAAEDDINQMKFGVNLIGTTNFSRAENDIELRKTIETISNKSLGNLKKQVLIKETDVNTVDLKKVSDEEILNRKPKNFFRNSELPAQWTVIVHVCQNINVSYRYFIFVVDPHGRKQIRRWENYVTPRQIRTCSNGCERIDKFGIINNAYQVYRGWLTNERVIQYQFTRDSQLQIFKEIIPNKDTYKGVYIKIVPLHYKSNYPRSSLESNVEVVNMRLGESKLQSQDKFGVLYRPDDILIFHITLAFMEITSFAIVFHTFDKKPLGHAKVFPSDLYRSTGVIDLNIKTPDNVKTIGTLSLPFLIIQPTPFFKQYNFRTSFSHTWNPVWNSFDYFGVRSTSPLYYYTLAQFEKAYLLHADGIQFEVQLTADLVVIIYGRFGFYTAVKGVQPKTVNDLIFQLIKDTTYEQLKNSRVFDIVDGKIIEYPSHNSEPAFELRLFPTLTDFFHYIPKYVGAIIEVIYSKTLESGVEESDQTIDKNLYVDSIIYITQRFGCGRPIVITSLDPDVSTMLRFKQPMFSVGYTILGTAKNAPKYIDRRTKSFSNAINQAQSFELLTVFVYGPDIFPEPLMLKIANKLQIQVSVWDIKGSKELEKKYKDLNTIVAIIFGDVSILIGKTKNKFSKLDTIQYFYSSCLFKNLLIKISNKF